MTIAIRAAKLEHPLNGRATIRKLIPIGSRRRVRAGG